MQSVFTYLMSKVSFRKLKVYFKISQKSIEHLDKILRITKSIFMKIPIIDLSLRSLTAHCNNTYTKLLKVRYFIFQKGAGFVSIYIFSFP